MKTISITLLAIVIAVSYDTLFGQNPGKIWMRYERPEDAGWSSEQLLSVSKNSNAASIMLIYRGNVVFAYGEYWRRFKIHSARKSLLNALYGIYVEKGQINLHKTLGELNIRDMSALSEAEKQAQIIDLLKCRSGVYLPAGQETEYQRKIRPMRESHPPNTFWYYNNWDFNVLGTIFRQETGRDIFAAFYSEIAQPLHMQDFRPEDGAYDDERQYSIHPAYAFKMSCRDLARFGQLYLQLGTWDGKRIISEDWINRSVTSYSKTDEGNSTYGLLWWVDENFYNTKMFYAAGYGGQRVYVFPSWDIVFVMNADTYTGNSVYDLPYVVADLVITTRNSSPRPNPNFVPLEEPKETPVLQLGPEAQKKFEGEYAIDTLECSITQINGELFLEGLHFSYRFQLLPKRKNLFYVEDIDLLLYFDMTDNAVQRRLEIHKSEAEAELFHLILAEGIQTAARRFPSLQKRIQNKEELRFLANQLERRGGETLEVKKWNALLFPYSYRVQQELKDELLRKCTLQEAADIFKAILTEVQSRGMARTKTEWFYRILMAHAESIPLRTEDILAYVGDYGQRHVTSAGRELYYHYGDDGQKYRLLKINDTEFAVENVYNMIVRFHQDLHGEVSGIASCYYRDTCESSQRNQ